ncbi:MAG: hypothetical protein ABI563_02770 [Specibacter sp.]
MFVRDMLVSCLRRWYFVVLGLIITGVATYFAFNMVLPTYEAKASIVLIPPAVAVTVGDNPYLYLGGLEQALGVLQVKASSPEVAAPLLDKFPGSSMAISKDPTTSGPIMAITVAADTPEQTMALLKGTLELVPSTLTSLQTELKVPAASVITSMPLSLDVEPTKIAKKQIQMTAMAGVGGLAATLLITGFIDRLMSRGKKGRSKEKDPGDAEQPSGPRLLVKDELHDVRADADTTATAGRRVKSRRTSEKRSQELGPAEADVSVDVGT